MKFLKFFGIFRVIFGVPKKCVVLGNGVNRKFLDILLCVFGEESGNVAKMTSCLIRMELQVKLELERAVSEEPGSDQSDETQPEEEEDEQTLAEHSEQSVIQKETSGSTLPPSSECSNPYDDPNSSSSLKLSSETSTYDQVLLLFLFPDKKRIFLLSPCSCKI